MDIRRLNQSSGFRERIVGIDSAHPLLDGRLVRYINLDNAASTPPLRDVLDAVEQFLPYYSSVHRGTGFKSRLSTAAYDEAHETRKEYKGDYFPVPETGEYLPSGYRDTIADCFSLAGKSFSRQITSRTGLARARTGIASG